MRKVIYSEYVKKTGGDRRYSELEEMGEAVFHQFGIDYQEFESGGAPYTTAIIELPDGSMKNIAVENVRFIDDKEETVVEINIVREMFRFNSKQHWENTAQAMFENSGVRKDFYILVDKSGNVCKMGKHFAEAAENDNYPVICYEIRF